MADQCSVELSGDDNWSVFLRKISSKHLSIKANKFSIVSEINFRYPEYIEIFTNIDDTATSNVGEDVYQCFFCVWLDSEVD